MHDRLPARSAWAHRALALAVSLPLATAGLLAAGQVAASAHTTAIQGHAVCDPATGTYSVTWVGATDLVPLGDVATVTTTSHSPSASTVPATVTTGLAPNAPYTFVQSGIPGTATTALVGVHVVWGPNPVNPNNLPTSNFAADASGSITGLTGCAKTVVHNQTIAGSIYDCVNGAATTAVRPNGTLAVAGTALTGGSTLSPANVPAGTYTMNATAPAGYQLVACGQAGSPSSKSVVVPQGGTGVGSFYVTPTPVVVPPTQTIAGSIYDCVNGAATTAVRPNGTLAVAGTALTGGSTLSPANVPAGTYTMNATAPAGYQLVACGQAGSPSSKSVVVPQGGTGVGSFYVTPTPVVVPPTQTIAGSIYDCVNGAATTAVRPNGTLAVAGTALTGGSTLSPANVPAGTYTMNATAPAGYQLVACGQAGSPSSKSVVVPQGGTGVGSFYVTPTPVVVPPTQTIAGSIYDCVNGAATTAVRPNGTLAVAGTALTGGSTLSPANVPAGTYTMNATAPAGYQLVACGQAGSPSSKSVVVPQGGTGVGSFYVTPTPVVLPPTQTIEAHIYDCIAGQRGTVEHTGGQVGATGPVNQAVGPNPLPPTPVAAGTYDVVAVAPAGFHLVTCPAAGPATSHETVTVPAGGAANAAFFVAPNAAGTPTRGTTTGAGQGPTVRPVVTPPAPVVTVRPPTHGVTTAPAAPIKALPFTGSDSGAIVRLGVLLLASGVALLVLGGIRRREV